MRLKRFSLIGFLAVFLLFIMGCASNNKETFQRGWVGGDLLEVSTSLIKKNTSNYFSDRTGVIPMLPGSLKDTRTGAVLVSRVFAGIPISEAGIEEGDLILKVDGVIIEDVKDFHKIIDKKSPGSEVGLTVFRKEEIIEKSVITGKEEYQNWHSLGFGFRLGDKIELIPKPDFSIFSLLSFQKNNNRLELHSPEFAYVKEINTAKDNALASEHETSKEGWEFWVLIAGFGTNKVILTQELYNASDASN